MINDEPEFVPEIPKPAKKKQDQSTKFLKIDTKASDGAKNKCLKSTTIKPGSIKS